MGIYEEILLEEEQKQLLAILVEASRNVPHSAREKFMVMPRGDSPQWNIIHHGLKKGQNAVHITDVEILADNGLLLVTYGSRGTMMFDITPQGYAYYREMKQQGTPSEHVEREVRSFVQEEKFRTRYPAAHAKWAEAESLLWSSDSQRQLTTVGHICREAIQEFAATLVARIRPNDADENPTNTVARLRAVLMPYRKQLGKGVASFLDAIIVFWGTVSDLVQRQEHGAQKEGEILHWEDARRVVFQTLIVMYEVDRAIALLEGRE